MAKSKKRVSGYRKQIELLNEEIGWCVDVAIRVGGAPKSDLSNVNNQIIEDDQRKIRTLEGEVARLEATDE